MVGIRIGILLIMSIFSFASALTAPHGAAGAAKSDHPVKVWIPLQPLPTLMTTKFEVTQGNNSLPSHYGSEKYAWDLVTLNDHDTQVADFPIAAAFSGTIVGLSDAYDIRCIGLDQEDDGTMQGKVLKNCWTYANFILIQSDDVMTYRIGSNAPQPDQLMPSICISSRTRSPWIQIRLQAH